MVDLSISHFVKRERERLNLPVYRIISARDNQVGI